MKFSPRVPPMWYVHESFEDFLRRTHVHNAWYKFLCRIKFCFIIHYSFSFPKRLVHYMPYAYAQRDKSVQSFTTNQKNSSQRWHRQHQLSERVRQRTDRRDVSRHQQHEVSNLQHGVSAHRQHPSTLRKFHSSFHSTSTPDCPYSVRTYRCISASCSTFSRSTSSCIYPLG